MVQGIDEGFLQGRRPLEGQIVIGCERHRSHEEGREDAGGIEKLLGSLPMYGWMDVETIPLTRHPDDPGVANLW